MADAEPRAGELTTANYGWTKPNVGDSDDAWGGMINADLDSIDSVVHGIQTSIPAAYVLPTASTSVLGGVKVDGSTITIAGGVISGARASITIGDTAPSSPSAGALWYDSVGGQLYVFYNDGNSSQWVIAVNAGALLTPASTTVLGAVKVDGTTIKAAGDGTISTIVVPMGDNRIINGDFRIDQRNNGASQTTAFIYTVDRWQYNGSLSSKFTWGRNLNAVAGPVGFPYYLGFQTLSVYAPTSGQSFGIQQAIEADMISDFAFGTASAQSITLSFWAYSSLTGTFGGVVSNYAGSRSYPFAYSIPVANTWTRIVLTIPGDTAGTWVMSGNAGSLYVIFDLGSGTNLLGTAGAWVASYKSGVTGEVSVISTLNATFYVTGVKLEIGSVATAYNRQSLAKSMADCQRYYQQLGSGASNTVGIQGYAGVASTQSCTVGYPAMRAVPTAAAVGSFTASNAGTVNLYPGLQTMLLQANPPAAGGFMYYNANAAAYIALTAEL